MRHLHAAPYNLYTGYNRWWWTGSYHKCGFVRSSGSPPSARRPISCVTRSQPRPAAVARCGNLESLEADQSHLAMVFLAKVIPGSMYILARNYMFLPVLSNVSMTPICFGSDSESTSGGQMVPVSVIFDENCFCENSSSRRECTYFVLICRQQYGNIDMN